MVVVLPLGARHTSACGCLYITDLSYTYASITTPPAPNLGSSPWRAQSSELGSQCFAITLLTRRTTTIITIHQLTRHRHGIPSSSSIQLHRRNYTRRRRRPRRPRRRLLWTVTRRRLCQNQETVVVVTMTRYILLRNLPPPPPPPQSASGSFSSTNTRMTSSIKTTTRAKERQRVLTRNRTSKREFRVSPSAWPELSLPFIERQHADTLSCARALSHTHD